MDLLVRTDFMEKAGTGIQRINDACKANNNTCDFNFSDAFWITMHSNFTESVTPQATPQVTPQVQNLIMVLHGYESMVKLQDKLGLSDRKFFRLNYIKPALELGYITTEFPNLNHPKQRYCLTEKGLRIKEQMNN